MVRKHDFHVLFNRYLSCDELYIPMLLQMAIRTFLNAFYYKDLHILSLQSPTRYKHQLKGGGQSRVLWTGEDLQGFDPITLDNKGIKLDHNGRYKYICSCLSSDYENYVTLSPNIIAANVPIINLLNQPRRQLLLLSAFHCNLNFTTRSAIGFIRSELRQHQCESKCRPTLALFQYVSDAVPEHLRVRKFRLKHNNKVKSEYSFPPLPLDKYKINQVVNNFCNELDQSNWIEGGCLVCGLLYPIQDLQPLDQMDIKLSLLEVMGQNITRQERYSKDDSIKEINGPIVASTCKHICKGCLRSLKESRIPTNALANGLWLGEVPSQLSNLTWTEKLMISRVNHNYCVISVKESGMRKMRANAVAHMVPIPKVYAALPPSKDELDEVLAFLYIGPTPPTDKEYRRTPLLVRKKKVIEALEWLKLNHCDYADVGISYANLNTYEDNMPPVIVDYHPSSNTVDPEATAVHDNGAEEGTTEGPCPFVVHGLIGENMIKMSRNEIRARALKHFKDGNHALGIGQAEHPESLYGNPQLYPQMFPWLFPYGLGGLGNSRGFKPVSDAERKQQLLMYHDKRFQLEPHFPLIAFNHEQIKGSTTGGFLLAEQQRFSDVADRLLNLDDSTLTNIIERLKSGEMIIPEMQQEKDCYQLIQDIDHVAFKVQGSNTNRKYMRNEIWSLMSYLGAPSWFVTFSPADVNHPLCLYFADTQQTFFPEWRPEHERMKLIADNPVAGARFFKAMVELFIKHVLGVGSKHSGVYGDTSGFYGTVEQQGRLTLHMHMLVWIKGALSPQEIRERILDSNSDFQQRMVEYLESVHMGEFMDATMENVRQQIDDATLADKNRTPPLRLYLNLRYIPRLVKVLVMMNHVRKCKFGGQTSSRL